MAGDLQNGPWRRWRAEWAPTSWDLGAPVSLYNPTMYADSPMRSWLQSIFPEHQDCAGSRIHLYPGGFVRVKGGLPRRDYDFYAVPERLTAYIWPLWISAASGWGTPFGQSAVDKPEVKLVTAQTLEREWRRFDTPGSPPRLSDCGSGWLVARDGTMFELVRPESSDAGRLRQRSEFAVETRAVQLPDTMTSLRYQVFTRGTRRFHKQSGLGAGLIFIGWSIIGAFPGSEGNPVLVVAAIPLFVGLWQWFVGRCSVHRGQVAATISRGTYREPRLIPQPIGSYTPRSRRNRMARWLVVSIVKRATCLASRWPSPLRSYPSSSWLSRPWSQQISVP
jgi:hypothetical protein